MIVYETTVTACSQITVDMAVGTVKLRKLIDGTWVTQRTLKQGDTVTLGAGDYAVVGECSQGAIISEAACNANGDCDCTEALAQALPQAIKDYLAQNPPKAPGAHVKSAVLDKAGATWTVVAVDAAGVETTEVTNLVTVSDAFSQAQYLALPIT